MGGDDSAEAGVSGVTVGLGLDGIEGSGGRVTTDLVSTWVAVQLVVANVPLRGG